VSRSGAVLGFIIFALLGFFWGQRRCPPPIAAVYTDTLTVTVVDSFPVPYQVTDGPDVPPTDIDTAEIISRFLDTARYRIDTIINEVRLSYDIGLNRNRIFDLRYSLQNTRPTALLLPEKNNSLGGGLLVGPGLFSPELYYRRKSLTFSLGYNLAEENSPLPLIVGLKQDLYRW